MTLLLLPFYLLLVIFVIRWILKQIEGRGKRWLMFLLLVFLFYLPLGWDVILGRAYFHYLCATQGGVHVYQTVELGPEYFDKNGIPLFFERTKTIDKMTVANRYKGDEYGEDFSKAFNIYKTVDGIVDTKPEEILGDITYFTYFGGWFMNHTGFHSNGTRCPDYKDQNIIDLSMNIFLKE